MIFGESQAPTISENTLATHLEGGKTLTGHSFWIQDEDRDGQFNKRLCISFWVTALLDAPHPEADPDSRSRSWSPPKCCFLVVSAHKTGLLLKNELTLRSYPSDLPNLWTNMFYLFSFCSDSASVLLTYTLFLLHMWHKPANCQSNQSNCQAMMSRDSKVQHGYKRNRCINTEFPDPWNSCHVSFLKSFTSVPCRSDAVSTSVFDEHLKLSWR